MRLLLRLGARVPDLSHLHEAAEAEDAPRDLVHTVADVAWRRRRAAVQFYIRQRWPARVPAAGSDDCAPAAGENSGSAASEDSLRESDVPAEDRA